MKRPPKVTHEEIKMTLEGLGKDFEWFLTEDFRYVVNDKGISHAGFMTYLGEQLMEYADKHGVNPFHLMAYAMLRYAKQSDRNEDHKLAQGIMKFMDDHLDNYDKEYGKNKT
jgi:hypothetical protein